MDTSEHTYYRGLKRRRDPITFLCHQVWLWNYRFRVCFALYVMTPGEQVAVYLFCLTLLCAVFWLSYHVFEAVSCAVVQLLGHSPGTSEAATFTEFLSMSLSRVFDPDPDCVYLPQVLIGDDLSVAVMGTNASMEVIPSSPETTALFQIS